MLKPFYLQYISTLFYFAIRIVVTGSVFVGYFTRVQRKLIIC